MDSLPTSRAIIPDMNQHEIVQKTTLLRRDGSLAECGWARHPYFAYRRDYVKGPLWLRLKEWDYYAILDERAGFWCALTYSDLGYAGLFAVAYVDLTLGKAVQCDSIRLLSRHRSGLGTSSTDDGSSTYCDKDGKLTLTFIRRGDLRHIIFNAPDLVLPDGRRGLLGDFSLYQNREKESINIASSWAEDRKAFYLNEKVVGMRAVDGFIRRGGHKSDLSQDGALAILDWGRGRWTRENTWYWASATGVRDGKVLGLNLGYGFSDRSSATENAFFIDDRLVKLDQVTFEYGSDLMKDWRMKDDDGRLDLVFTPCTPRTSRFNALVILSDQKQYFGTFSGTLIDDDGSPVHLDGLCGFAEIVHNKW